MGRYPTKLGYAVSPYEIGYTVPSSAQIERRGLVNVHHKYFYRRSYETTAWRQVFRNLSSNMYPLLVDEHQELHEEYDPPKMPSDTLMIDYIESELATNGLLIVQRRKDIINPRIITHEQWKPIREQFDRVV